MNVFAKISVFILAVAVTSSIYNWLYFNFVISKTVYEPNDLANYIYRHRDAKKFPLRAVERGDSEWETICLLFPGSNVEREIKGRSISVGNKIDEGILQYLYKLVITTSVGTVEVLNFDDRLYRIDTNFMCSNVDKVYVEVNRRPSGVVYINISE